MTQLIFIFFLNITYSQISTNYNVLDSLSKSQSIDIANTIKNNNLSEFEVHFKGPFNPIIYKSNLINTLDSLNLLNVSGADSVNIDLIKYGVNYYLTDNNEKIKREIQIKSFLFNKTLSNIYIDTISIDEIEYIEDSNFQELKSNIPKPKKTFIDFILEPVILIGTGLITVVLLFTVRS